MMKLNCDICLDLLPLVQDGAASEATCQAVKEHLESCEHCKQYVDGMSFVQKADSKGSWKIVQQRLTMCIVFLLAMGMLFGVSLTGQGEMFYNSVIMPILGLFGYIVFRKKSFYLIPLILFCIHGVTNVYYFLIQKDYLDVISFLLWTVLYGIFALLGSGIGLLLHVTIAGKKRATKFVAASVSLLITLGILVFTNSLNGNPISKYLAYRCADHYLKEQYTASDYKVEKAAYNFKDGVYHVHIVSPNHADRSFTITVNSVGKLLNDDYSYRVEEGANTADRLWKEYREAVDRVLLSPSFAFQSDLAYGDLDTTKISIPLEPDQIYDVQQLGKEAGTIVIYLEDETVTKERAFEMMHTIKQQLHQGGISFHEMNFVLEEKEGTEELRYERIRYEEIP